jgi:hypothetical protein
MITDESFAGIAEHAILKARGEPIIMHSHWIESGVKQCIYWTA